MPRLSTRLFPVLLALASPAAAQAATYTGYFDDGNGHIYGQFTGEDRDGDARISQSELIGFSATMDNMNGGPGQYRVNTTQVSDFLFADLGDGTATLSGVLSFQFFHDGGWPRAFAMASFGYWVDQPLSTTHVQFFLDTPSVAAVPLPAGAALLPAGLGVMALLRRRRRRA